MTFVGVEVGAGRSKLRLKNGNLAPRVVSLAAAGAKVALVATTALLLGGDVVDLELEVGSGAWLEIVETAGTIAYDADGQSSSWNVRVNIAKGGLLLWHGEPLVLGEGANTLRCSQFDLEEDAVCCVRETVVLGRTGELGGAVRMHNRVRQGGRSVLIEELDLRDVQTRRLPGILGPAHVIDTLTLLGIPAPEYPMLPVGTRFDIDQSVGTVGRALRSGLAGSPVSDWWSAWSGAARMTYEARTAETPVR